MRPTVSASLFPKEEIDKAPPADGAALSFRDGARKDRPPIVSDRIRRTAGASLAPTDPDPGRTHKYVSSYVPAYQVMACNNCYAANCDDWALHLEEAVTRSLKASRLVA